ncbi:MAG: hypothetical protein E6G38_08220 [Actinobacteria bacterium]|nr:MAG: hypothetical protein E6G38_08220 [Actinomycetota bacterium]
MAIVGALTLGAPALRARVAAGSARVGPLEVVVALGTAVAAVAGTIGADTRWLPALGRIIVNRGEIPDGIPYATAPSAGWHNVPVLAELILRGLTSAAGDRGLLLAQVVAVAAALAILAWDLRRSGADDLGGALVIIVVVVGALPVLIIARSQLFSLLLFPVLIALLRAEARSPSLRVWLLPPLLALWSNLHGAVLIGLAVAAAYLIFGRGRRQPYMAGAVLITSALAVCTTPALQHTPDYYRGLVGNEAARRGEGLWAPLSLTSGFDLLLLAAAIVLLALAFRAHPRLWEAIALAGLAVLTVKTARSGVWLLFFAVTPAARSLHPEPGRERRLAGPLLAAAVALALFGLVRGPQPSGAGKPLLDEALRIAGGTPILAEGIPAEQVALAGGQVWMSNPIDAFDRRDQRIYLDWLAGRGAGEAALRHVEVILVIRGSRPAKRLRGLGAFRPAAHDANAMLYVRRH